MRQKSSKESDNMDLDALTLHSRHRWEDQRVTCKPIDTCTGHRSLALKRNKELTPAIGDSSGHGIMLMGFSFFYVCRFPSILILRGGHQPRAGLPLPRHFQEDPKAQNGKWACASDSFTCTHSSLQTSTHPTNEQHLLRPYRKSLAQNCGEADFAISLFSFSSFFFIFPPQKSSFALGAVALP